MARAAIDLPSTFSGPLAPETKRDLERFATGVRMFIGQAALLFAPRWQRLKPTINPPAASFDFAAHIVLAVDQNFDLIFPPPAPIHGGRELLVILENANGIARAHGVSCRIDGETSYTFVAEPGAYRFYFDGQNYWSYTPGASS